MKSKSIKKLLSVYLCASIVSFPMIGSGQGGTIPIPISSSESLTKLEEEAGLVLFHGVKGKFYPIDKLKKVLTDLSQGKKAIELSTILSRRLELEQHRSKLLEFDIQSYQKESSIWKSTAESQAKQLVSSHSFWKSPALWFAIGTITTVVGFTTAISVTK